MPRRKKAEGPSGPSSIAGFFDEIRKLVDPLTRQLEEAIARIEHVESGVSRLDALEKENSTAIRSAGEAIQIHARECGREAQALRVLRARYEEHTIHPPKDQHPSEEEEWKDPGASLQRRAAALAFAVRAYVLGASATSSVSTDVSRLFEALRAALERFERGG